ncbi:hypothetical protein ACJIZ3_020169 [Penstemon smallii]|uniref:MATH domain-containing protein n=1 Tax=Penstemon smallii TaxID=265156 RepID=A0ABD3SIG2_9LAMI
MVDLDKIKSQFKVTLEIRNFSPTHFLFKIESFSLLSQNGVNKYESNEFSAGNYKWRLIFNFNWEDSGNEVDNVAIYLALANSSSLPTRWEVNAVFSIFLYNQNSDNFLSVRGPARRFHALKTEWGFSKFISKKSLIDPCNGYLVNDNCVFGAEVFVIEPQGVIERLSMLEAGKPEDHSWSISQFSKLKNGWFSEEFLTRDHKWYSFFFFMELSFFYTVYMVVLKGLLNARGTLLSQSPMQIRNCSLHDYAYGFIKKYGQFIKYL